MNAFQKHLAADRRLCILRLLYDFNGSANESVLHSALEAMGHRVAREQVREDLRFLVENGCIISDYIDTVQVLQITRRGVDVQRGHIDVDGIKKPSIGV